jgi:hypothetical protein
LIVTILSQDGRVTARAMSIFVDLSEALVSPRCDDCNPFYFVSMAFRFSRLALSVPGTPLRRLSGLKAH